MSEKNPGKVAELEAEHERHVRARVAKADELVAEGKADEAVEHLKHDLQRSVLVISVIVGLLSGCAALDYSDSSFAVTDLIKKDPENDFRFYEHTPGQEKQNDGDEKDFRFYERRPS